MGWKIDRAEGFAPKLRRYLKKYEAATEAALKNLDMYIEALQRGCNPLQINGGFVHPEFGGVVALDETGCEEAQWHPTRIYIYPHVETKTLWLITIGDKETQKRTDIPVCRKFIKRLKC